MRNFFISCLMVVLMVVLTNCQINNEFVSDFESKALAVGYTSIGWGIINDRPFAAFYLKNSKSKLGSSMLLVVNGQYDEATQKKLLNIAMQYRWRDGEGGVLCTKQSRVEGPDGKILWDNPVDFAVLGVKNINEAKKALKKFQD